MGHLVQKGVTNAYKNAAVAHDVATGSTQDGKTSIVSDRLRTEALRAWEAILPWPPSTNHYWRNVGNAVLISAEGRQYAKDIAVLTAGKQGLGDTSRLSVLIIAYPPDNRRRDLDNLTKSLLDALGKAEAFGDDSQIDELHLIRGKVQKGGSVSVAIVPIGEFSGQVDECLRPLRYDGGAQVTESIRGKI